MTRWSAITRTRGRRSTLAYGSRSTTAAEDNLNQLVHHHRGRYCYELMVRGVTHAQGSLRNAGAAQRPILN
jgi:hypothetical protein